MDKSERNEYAAPISAYYDAMSGTYTQITETAKYGVPKWLEAALGRTDLKAPRVLDLACANGTLGAIVKNKFPDCSLTGLDISPGMIEELKKPGLYDEAVVCDLSLGLPSSVAGGFDLALAIGFLEFLKDPVVLLKDVSRVLKPRGVFLASFEIYDPAKYQAKRLDNPGAGFPRYLYDLADIEAMLGASGLRMLSNESIVAYVSPSTGEPRNYHMLALERK